MKQDIATQLKGLDLLENLALNEGAWWMRLSSLQVLMGLRQSAEAQESEDAKSMVSRISTIIETVKSTETNDMIKGMLGE